MTELKPGTFKPLPTWLEVRMEQAEAWLKDEGLGLLVECPSVHLGLLCLEAGDDGEHTDEAHAIQERTCLSCASYIDPVLEGWVTGAIKLISLIPKDLADDPVVQFVLASTGARSEDLHCVVMITGAICTQCGELGNISEVTE